MVFKIIAFLIISGIPAIKRPIYGGIVGCVTAPVINILYSSFDLVTVLVLAAFGFGFGLVWGTFAWNLFHGEEYNQQNKKTYVMPMGKAGTGQRGEIIYTDDEEKNARENEKRNIR